MRGSRGQERPTTHREAIKGVCGPWAEHACGHRRKNRWIEEGRGLIRVNALPDQGWRPRPRRRSSICSASTQAAAAAPSSASPPSSPASPSSPLRERKGTVSSLSLSPFHSHQLRSGGEVRREKEGSVSISTYPGWR
jgi:hypothetical protein